MTRPNITRRTGRATAASAALLLLLGFFHANSGLADGDLYVEAHGVGIGTENPQRQLHIVGDNAVFRMDRNTDTAAFMLVRTTATGTPLKTFVLGTNASGSDDGEFVINDLGGNVGGPGQRRLTIDNAGDIHFTGVVHAPSYVQTSSERYKVGVQTLVHAGAGVQQLRGVRFNWRDSGQPSLGLIAEEVQSVYPELVEVRDGRPVAVNYSALVAVLVEAHKEQQQRINHLESRLAETESLQTRLHAVEQALAAHSMRAAAGPQ